MCRLVIYNFVTAVITDMRTGECDTDQLLCIHLPDYTSTEVGPVMSLLYYGEVWLCEAYINVCQVNKSSING